MVGGLLQMISSGKQDVYLTFNPEITFFKRIYKKYTNFAIEFQEILPDYDTEYNNIISFKIKNGDAIHRCYLEVSLPNLLFDDSYIYNKEYFDKKKLDKINLQKIHNINKSKYDDLSKYINIDLELYRKIYNLLLIDNITLHELKDSVYEFNNIYKSKKEIYINKIDNNIYLEINISKYILSIDKIITSDILLDNNIYILKDNIINNLSNIYNIMIYYLSKYNNIINKLNKKINNIDNTKIKFNYAKYLGHNYFQYFSINVGGNEINKYSNDILHIDHSHRINEDYINNYLNMIGHKTELNSFNTNSKGNTKIIVPLIFWFNRIIGSCLPIVALQYSDISIISKINDIKKIICFENHEEEFNDMLIVTDLFKSYNNININNKLIYSNYTIDYNNKNIIYDCLFMNNELITYTFPDLLSNEITYILENNGTYYESDEIFTITNKIYEPQYLINKYEWIKLMCNLNNDSFKYNNFYYKFASYYPYIDFNLYYGLIPQPSIKLICEIIYFDDVERNQFANSNLEYIIESYDENIYTVKNSTSFDCELSFNNLCKELYWYIQPQILYDGLTTYGQNTSLIYDSHIYFNNDIIQYQQLILDKTNSLFKNVDDNYYTYLLSYKYFNNILINGIYYKSFCLYPEEGQPSGTINFRYFKNKQYFINFNNDFIKEYNTLLSLLYGNNNKNLFILKFISKNYELLTINKGKLNIIYSK